MANPVQILGLMFILSFALLTLIAGLFTLYFGAGKSKKIGAVLFVVGLIIFVFSAYMHVVVRNWYFKDVSIINSLLTIVGVILGAAASVGLFLVAIMKS